MPLADIVAVAVSAQPWTERPWRRLRVGTGLPFVILVGRTCSRACTDSVAVYRTPAVVLTLKPGARFRAVICSSADAEKVAAEVEAALRRRADTLVARTQT